MTHSRRDDADRDRPRQRFIELFRDVMLDATRSGAVTIWSRPFDASAVEFRTQVDAEAVRGTVSLNCVLQGATGPEETEWCSNGSWHVPAGRSCHANTPLARPGGTQRHRLVLSLHQGIARVTAGAWI